MAGKKPPCSLAGGRLWGCDHRVRGGQYVVCELTVLDVWVYGEGGGTRGVGHTPPTAAVGSHQWGNWGMVRYASRSASNPPPLCKIDFTTRPWGTYIYAEEGAPHTGVNLRDKRPCEANRERLSLFQHSPPQRSLAPIVNGLSTDVKLLFFLPPDFLFVIRWQQRVVSASIQEWQEFGMGLREMPSNPIQSDSILSPIQILTATVFVASFLNIGQFLVIFYSLFLRDIFLFGFGHSFGLSLPASTPLPVFGRQGLWGLKTTLVWLCRIFLFLTGWFFFSLVPP